MCRAEMKILQNRSQEVYEIKRKVIPQKQEGKHITRPHQICVSGQGETKHCKLCGKKHSKGKDQKRE